MPPVGHSVSHYSSFHCCRTRPAGERLEFTTAMSATNGLPPASLLCRVTSLLQPINLSIATTLRFVALGKLKLALLVPLSGSNAFFNIFSCVFVLQPFIFLFFMVDYFQAHFQPFCYKQLKRKLHVCQLFVKRTSNIDTAVSRKKLCFCYLFHGFTPVAILCRFPRVYTRGYILSLHRSCNRNCKHALFHKLADGNAFLKDSCD
jgi:glucan phosphoethanolaminetransferase (alkaline phosphatase superfamily)